MSDNVAERNVEQPAADPAKKLRLMRPHVLIQRTLDLKVEKDQWGNLRHPAWQGVDVRVSKEAKRNALIVFDRLFKLLEKHGVEISVSTGDYGASGTFAVQNRKDEVRVYVSDKVQLYVAEEYKKIPHVPTAKELRDQQQPFPSRIPKFDSVPTGKLTLVPGGIADLSSDDAVDALVTKATDEIMQQLEDERIRREAADAHRRRESQRQKEEQEEKVRVNAFHKAANELRQYREIMDYIDEVRRFGRVPNDQRKEGQTLEEWLQWAEWRARQIHPLG